MRPTTLGPFPRTRARPLVVAVMALVPVLVAGAAAADPASAATGDRRGRPSIAAHDDPGCRGRATSSVTGTFSAQVDGLTGPLVAVVVRNGSGVVATGLALVDPRGRGCADLPALDPGRYTLTASDQRQRVRSGVRVLGPSATPTPTPVPVPTTPTPAPPPSPTPPTTPTPTPTSPTAGPTPLPTRPSTTPQPVPRPSSTAAAGSSTPPPAGPGSVGATAAPTGTSATPSTQTGPTTSSTAAAAPAASPSSTPGPGTASAYAGSPLPGGAAEEAVAGWRLAAQVAAVVLAAALIIALLVLVQSRSTGRWDQDG